MDTITIYDAAVPVFRHYLIQLDKMLDKLTAAEADLLNTPLTDGALNAGEHWRTAQGYVLRALWPLIGEPIPDLSTDGTDIAALKQRGDEVLHLLSALTPAHFAGAAQRRIFHKAGFCDLDQSGADFLTLYAMPNFFFHISMGYAGLRTQNVDLGKGDFDGHHSYPKGFQF